MGTSIEDLVQQGHDALKRGDGASARFAFSSALEQASTGEILQGLGDAEYLEHAYGATLELYEKAYSAYRDEGKALGAIRTARELAFLHGSLRGDGAVMSGWMGRAQTLLEEVEDSSERGWIALNRGMFEGHRPTKERLFREAFEIARQHQDSDLEFTTLAYLGASLVHSDRTEEGMMLLDEALAAVAGGEVTYFSPLSEIFCQLLSACEYACDVIRADQWIRVGVEVAARRNLPVVTAFCRTHYGGVLTAAGRWPEADAALSEASRIWGASFTYLRWTALVRLADLRVRQGRFEEAEQLLDGLSGYTEAARPLASVHLAKGETALAADTLERALEELGREGMGAVPLLSLLVDVELTRGDVDRAGRVVDQLEAIASRNASPYLRATAALARGRVLLAGGLGDPSACLREALSGFTKANLPMELARARMDLARALTEERPEVAIAEAEAALEAFDRLQAARDADAAAALVRSLGGTARTGPKGGDTLTKREAQVLELIGHGFSNPEIADRLFISRKTVEHHVGNVLSKLRLRSRAEAAAYAAREKISP
ncbi:MAG: LuxR C-terminal-related transcriptional regulator [Actinomycetota bacterium]